MTTPPRIFVIGFNRCGTTSLHEFFEAAGRRPVHRDHGRLAVVMERNVAAGRRVIAGYEDYDVYSDLYCACVHGVYEANRHFRLLAEQEPDARFILNVRDVDRWVRSRRYWREMGMARVAPDYDGPCDPPRCEMELTLAHRRHWSLESDEEVYDHWRAQWHAHRAAVTAELPPGRLLVFDIERDDPRNLCRFAGLPDGMARNWKRRNRSVLAPSFRRVSVLMPEPVRRRIPAPVRWACRNVCFNLEAGLRSVHASVANLRIGR